jgi:hypothetical protein
MTPRGLAGSPKDLARLQQTLLKNDQTIKGLRNADPLDLARQAKVRASSELRSAKASLVTDGLLRDIPDAHGEPVEFHHWEGELPGWIQLEWEQPRRVREVRITFDSGFKRELTLSAQDTVNAHVIREPQPETVRDYTVKAGDKVVASVKGNHQRLKVHRFDAVETKSLRVEVQATNGADEARVFEIRCYA